MSKRILFVSHEASRTGAPKILLFFLRWLKANTDLQLFILFKRGGELLSEFEALGKVFIWPSEKINRFLLIKGMAKIGIPLEAWYVRYLHTRFRRYKFDLIYINSITCSDIIVSLKRDASLPASVVCHVHELKIIIQLLAPDLAEAKKYIDQYIAVSEATKQNLVDHEHVPEERIAVVYEFIPVDETQQTSSSPTTIRQKLGVPQNSLVIGGAGYVHWRKGHDLLISAAKIVDTLKPNNNFAYLWVGSISEENRVMVEEDIRKADLQGKIKFTGALANPQEYFQTYDIFVLPSREDPFPLVCLEAIALGKPIVCFEGAGGIPELVAKGCGVAVPYLDTMAMAKTIIEFAEDPKLLEKLSRKAKEISWEYDAETACGKLCNIIESVITP